MTEAREPTPKQWKRRALKAEAQLESIQKMRAFEHELEADYHRKIATYTVALKEAHESIAWALEQQT